MGFKLSDALLLEVEPAGNRVRLVVYNGGVENVCRLESVKNIISFIRGNDIQLFKGRLQLHKADGGIAVVVKGQLEGEILVDDLMACLEAVKFGKNLA